jgi:WD repeat-containing protein 48
LNSKRHVLTLDSDNCISLWDIIECCKKKDYGKANLEKIYHEINTEEWVANWCTVDIKNGDITIHLDEGRCYDAEIYYQDLVGEKECLNDDQRSLIELIQLILGNGYY